MQTRPLNRPPLPHWRLFSVSKTPHFSAYASSPAVGGAASPGPAGTLPPSVAPSAVAPVADMYSDYFPLLSLNSFFLTIAAQRRDYFYKFDINPIIDTPRTTIPLQIEPLSLHIGDLILVGGVHPT